MKTVLCTRCAQVEVPAPDSIEIDPICEPCAKDLRIEEKACPGYNDSCGGLREGDNDLCPDCTIARLDFESPRPGTDRRNY